MKETRKCDWCGEKFIATRKDARFCQAKCRDKFNNDERRQAVIAIREIKAKETQDARKKTSGRE